MQDEVNTKVVAIMIKGGKDVYKRQPLRVTPERRSFRTFLFCKSVTALWI